MINITKIQQALSEKEFGAMLLTNRANILYATGFDCDACALLISEGGAWFFTDSRYIEAAAAAISGVQVRMVTHDDPYSAQIKALLDDNRISSVGYEESSITHFGYREWRKKLKVKLVPAQRILIGLRAVKSSGDLEKMKKAQRIAERSFNEILPLISADITEKDLAAELLYRFLKNGADDKSFDVIAVSGPKTSMPHGVPGNVKIGKGFLTLDFGVKLDGWCSDTTRTLCIGEPDGEMRKIYDTVLRAQTAGIAAARAGIKGKAVDAAARTIIEKAGYGENFGHGFGHGIGLEVHEAPSVSVSSKDKLSTGAVISAEPGIYLPGRYGVRIEDVIYITEDGCENITDLPKELIII